MWLLNCRLPPSLLQYFTGIPCPTSGMTRSILALFQGDFRGFLLFNPMTSLYLGLSVVSGGLLASRWWHQRALLLPNALVRAWFAVLACGWVTKFALGSRYW